MGLEPTVDREIKDALTKDVRGMWTEGLASGTRGPPDAERWTGTYAETGWASELLGVLRTMDRFGLPLIAERF